VLPDAYAVTVTGAQTAGVSWTDPMVTATAVAPVGVRLAQTQAVMTHSRSRVKTLILVTGHSSTNPTPQPVTELSRNYDGDKKQARRQQTASKMLTLVASVMTYAPLRDARPRLSIAARIPHAPDRQHKNVQLHDHAGRVHLTMTLGCLPENAS
jgi:hypothetical protein